MSEIELDSKKNYIINQVREFSKFEHVEIFKIFKKYNINFSENSNGIFVNLNYISESILDKIIHFIKFCITNKETLKMEIYKREELKKLMNVRNITDLQSEKPSQNQNTSNTNYERGFTYISDTTSDNNETYYKENTFIIPKI